jgi:hypothetical protein
LASTLIVIVHDSANVSANKIVAFFYDFRKTEKGTNLQIQQLVLHYIMPRLFQTLTQATIDYGHLAKASVFPANDNADENLGILRQSGRLGRQSRIRIAGMIFSDLVGLGL